MNAYLAVLQIRSGSSRLPGKPLLEVMGRPITSYLLDRIRSCKSVSRIIAATTDSPEDDELCEYFDNQGIDVFRGSQANVLDRVYRSVESVDDEYFIKFWGDSPLMDPALVDEIVESLEIRFSGYDYVSNNHPSTYPEGMQIEVVKVDALHRLMRFADLSDFDREHVTTGIWQHPGRYTLGNIEHVPDIHDRYRLVVDYLEDFEHIKAVLEALYPKNPNFTLKDAIRFLNDNPQVLEINRSRYESEAAYYDRISEQG